MPCTSLDYAMADEFPDPDEEFDLIHEADYEALRELEAETRQLSQSGPSRVSQTTNENRHQASVETLTPVNSSTVIDNSVPSSSKKRSYEELCGNDAPSSSKKRSYEEVLCGSDAPGGSGQHNYEDLFGDISDLLRTDILADDFVEEPREKKLRWDQPKDVIKKILDARQLLYEHSGGAAMKTKCANDKKNSISLRVPPWNFVAVTRSYDSQRLYVRVRSERKDVKKSTRGPIANLLSTSYRQLKAQAEEVMAKKKVVSSQQPASGPCNARQLVNDELWVDKYRPRSYLELLSDETVNRQFLHWMKLWDKIVFNRNIISKSQKKTQSAFGKKRDGEEKDIEEVDSKGYPVKRIALLSGPPGLGKTTLAHIAARHAGYNVVEINASDERSPDTFRQILLASTEMKAVMGADPRPNCLVFDEIDGAPAASIELLLKFVHGKLLPKAKKGKGQSEKASNGCARPVVCICNEPYAPTLRALRAAAVVIPVPEVSPLRLAERLMDIARKEKLDVDFGDLVKIAERSGCDVRACVGALQYMGSANLKENLSLGLKDTRKNLFDSWRNILMIPVNKGGVVAVPERIQTILKTVQNGETEKLAQGIFHNYPEICDRRLDNVSASLEWFQFYDLITSLVMHKQIWSLMPYTNFGFIAWHLHLARAQKAKLSYPTVVSEVTQRSAKNTGIVTAIRRVCGRDAFTLTTDIAGFLPDLLAPRLRTVPSHLYSSKEKADLARIVDLMLEFGLSFVQEKNPQGGYIYNLDPNILEVGALPNCNAHRYLAYAVQQIIAQELEVERLRRASILTGLGGSNTESTANSGKSETTENARKKSVNPETNAKSGKKDAVKALKEVRYKDFFGNIITSENGNVRKQDKAADRISPKGYSVMKSILTKHGTWYKYKEGCNNAVRRNVLMQKLL
ncbi:Chromosome transmission fidelity protein 18-like protein [Ooceraea biroi]|uniref:Chromosome transmission fidelity protein 18-like protein n=1 Tax=Ooceraea biroi TaxID=2015173 RepID=A0A026W7S8_OOCBI|nr:Chromosome transmission fidelity protein 18-like protein [Ooceraea biroi]